MSACKDELVDTSDQYFEWAKVHVAFLYPDLDLSQLDLFKVVRDNQIVCKEDWVPLNMIAHSFEKDVLIE